MSKNLIKFNSKFKFSFHDWCFGYIFQQLYKISENTFGNAFYLNDTTDVWFVYAVFEKTHSTSSLDTITIDLSYSRLNSENKFISEEDPTDYIQKSALSSIIHYLGLEDDLKTFYKFTTEFEEFKDLQEILPGYRLSSVLMKEWMPIFAYLSTNTTVDMYHTFLQNFLDNWGMKTGKEIKNMLSFPPLHYLRTISEHTYRQKTKIGYRAKYLPEILEKICEKDLFKNDSSNILLKRLQEIKGIGEYSARTTLLYGLRNYSVGFVDSFVKVVMNKYFQTDLKIANKTLLHLIDEKFAPYQGLVVDWLTAIYSYTNHTSKDKFFIVN